MGCKNFVSDLSLNPTFEIKSTPKDLIYYCNELRSIALLYQPFYLRATFGTKFHNPGM